MTNIKEKLLELKQKEIELSQSCDCDPVHTVNFENAALIGVAADHIKAQERRIAELESVMRQITHEGGSCAVILATKALAVHISGQTAPANAINADGGLLDIVRTLVCMADRMALPNSENYPSPLSNFSPLIIAARKACVDHGFTAGGLAIAAMKAAK